MKVLVVFAVVASFQFLDAIPLNGNVCPNHQNLEFSLVLKLVSKATFSKAINKQPHSKKKPNLIRRPANITSLDKVINSRFRLNVHLFILLTVDLNNSLNPALLWYCRS